MAASRRASVSLCMIVRNEERNLVECLRPVGSLFDEVVIVDTGSQDNTKQVAAQFTSKIFDFAWCDDFSAARNESLRRSLGDWVFWLDADDRLGPDNLTKLRALLESLDGQRQMFFMDTVCWSRYECEGPRLVTHPRLFRRHPDLRWQGRVHEQLRPDPVTLGHELIWSDVQIEHVGYRDDALRQRKLHRDVRLLRMDYAVNPDEPSTLVHLGLTYGQLGQNEEARKHLLRLERGNHGAAEWMRRVYGALGELSLREGKYRDALQVLSRGILFFPDDENLLYMQADCLYELDQFEAAQSALRKIITTTDSRQYHGGAPSDLKRKLAPRKLGDVLRVQGAYAEAVETLQAVVNEFPDDTLTWYALGRVYLDTHCREPMDAVARRLRACPQGGIFASLLLATWHLEHHEMEAARVLIEELIIEAPQMPMPRLLRVELLNRTNAPRPALAQACRDLLRVAPGNVEAMHLLDELESGEGEAPAEPKFAADQWCTSVVLGAGVSNGVIQA